MQAHAATFRIQPELWEQAKGTLGPAKAQIGAIPGLRLWLFVAGESSGEGVAVAVFEDEESYAVGVAEIEHILSGLQATLVSPWSPTEGEVLAFADNDWQDLIRDRS